VSLGARSASEAFRAGRWREACASLLATGIETLDVDDLERLAVCAHLTGAEETSLAAWRRAHAECTRLGAHSRAARSAFWLAFALLNRRDLARGGGWVDRAQHQLDDVGDDCVERGHLRYAAGLRAVFSGDVPAAHEAFGEAGAVAERFADPELATLARIGRGRCLIYLDRTPEGIALLDEAMVAVTGEEISAVAVGDSYCTVLDACQELLDVERVDAWSGCFTEWCERHPDVLLYRGQCLLHRAEVLQFHGAWKEAAVEVERARRRLVDPMGRLVIGAASYLRADLLRLTGRSGPAGVAYGEAGRSGRDPLPGLALLRADQGRLPLGLAALRRSLAETAFVELAVAGGDVPDARQAAEELTATSVRSGTPVLAAEAGTALGAVLLAEGDARRALAALRGAAGRWRGLGAPHREARARLLVGAACRALGDEDGAALEFGAARSVFVALGAAPDLDRLAAVAAAPGARSRDAGLTGREREVLTLVAKGWSNRAIAVDLVISERTVATHVGSILAKLGVHSRAAATAWAYEHGLAHS
jgi:DNA-binding CsgD family transcriptional regulator